MYLSCKATCPLSGVRGVQGCKYTSFIDSIKAVQLGTRHAVRYYRGVRYLESLLQEVPTVMLLEQDLAAIRPISRVSYRGEGGITWVCVDLITSLT